MSLQPFPGLAHCTGYFFILGFGPEQATLEPWKNHTLGSRFFTMKREYLHGIALKCPIENDPRVYQALN